MAGRGGNTRSAGQFDFDFTLPATRENSRAHAEGLRTILSVLATIALIVNVLRLFGIF